MCRFLLAKSENPIKQKTILEQFSIMAQKNKTYDGDWQGDGWGFSWYENSSWKLYRSIKPIWQDRSTFQNFPKTNLFSIHVRSASFPHHKNNIQFNQPYLSNDYIFVFNGLLKKVSLSIPGKIGAEKIWFLLKKNLRSKKPSEALEKVGDILKKNSKEIQALNIGLSDGKNIYTFSFFTKHPEYYKIRYFKVSSLSLISSEPIGEYIFDTADNNSIICL